MKQRQQPDWNPARAQEAHDEAMTILAVECPAADLSKLLGAGDAFEDGVWFGIAGTLSVLHRHGVIDWPGRGNPRETWGRD